MSIALRLFLRIVATAGESFFSGRGKLKICGCTIVGEDVCKEIGEILGKLVMFRLYSSISSDVLIWLEVDGTFYTVGNILI